MAFLASVATANASQVELLSVSGTWDAVTTVGNARITGEGTDEIRWGRPYPGYNGEKSGFRFEGDGGSGPFEVGTVFDVGTFTHLNNVIYRGEYLKVATLNLTLEAAFDGIVRTFTTAFNISLWETDNLADPCANGGANWVTTSVNRYGCADRVRLLTNSTMTDTFTVGGLTYTFDLLGFVNWGQDFWTVEQRDNSAIIQARFLVVDDREEVVDPPNPPVVPLPAGIWIMLTALGGFGVVRRLSRR